MDLKKFHETNVRRCEESFHKITDWSPTDWGCAMAGEVGEACNQLKKLLRLEGPTKKSGKANTPSDREEIIRKVGEEVADAVIYADLLLTCLGLDLESEVMNKFNKVSERVGSNLYLSDSKGQVCPRCKISKPKELFCSDLPVCLECAEEVEQFTNG